MKCRKCEESRAQGNEVFAHHLAMSPVHQVHGEPFKSACICNLKIDKDRLLHHLDNECEGAPLDGLLDLIDEAEALERKSP